MTAISPFINYLYCWIYSSYILHKKLNKILQEPDWSFVSFSFITLLHLLSFVLSLAVIRCHSLAFFITRCHSLSLVPFVATLFTNFHSLNHSSVFFKRSFFFASRFHFVSEGSLNKMFCKKSTLSVLQNPEENTYSFNKVEG